MSDTPPPELVERLVEADRATDEVSVLRHLAALAEWADGGLIDPTTWTVVDAEVDSHIDVWSQTDVAKPSRRIHLYTLSPRGGEL